MIRTPQPSLGWQHHELHTIEDMRRVLSALLAELRGRGYGDKEQFAIRLSLEEAIVNAIQHGHAGDTSKRVQFRFCLDGQTLFAEIEDEGPGFDPGAIPNPLAPENLEQPGGRGVFLMKHYMTAIRFNDRGNRVSLYKVREGAVPGANGVTGR